MTDLEHAEHEAQLALEEWNRFVETSIDRRGHIDLYERHMKLQAWMNAENKAGEIRRGQTVSSLR